VEEKIKKNTVMEELIAEMAKPHITASSWAGLKALVESQKTLTKAKE
jgi:hypothetical protein